MQNVEELLGRYISVWNESDPAARRATIEALWATEGRHFMGPHDAQGFDALEARVARSYQRSIVEGGNAFRLAGGVQVLPGVVKFRWDMAHRDTQAIAAAGVGFLRLNDDGRILFDYLFTEA